MVRMLGERWWMLLIRGIAAIIFGVLAFIWPGVTVWVLVVMFGAYALVDGIFSLIAAFAMRDRVERWWVMALEGVIGILAGIVVFVWPGVSALVLLYVIAIWAIITGILEIVAAIQLRREISGEWLLGLAGLASIVFGVLAILFPGAGALAVIWLIAAYAILFGIVLVALAFRVRRLHQQAAGT